MITYSQPEAAEIRESKDEWVVLPPLPTRVPMCPACEAEVSEWFTKEQINDYLHDLAFYMSRASVRPAPERQPTLEERFRIEADKWQRETAHLSSPLQRMTHPSYQAILGMGAEHKQDIVRLMLRDMQKTKRDWILALSFLTQENPVNKKDAGKTDKLIEAWVRWGKEQGLLQT